MIVRTGEDSPQERYWQDAATSITTGMVLHACYAAALEGRQASLADLAHIFTRPGRSFKDTLEELLNFEHDPDFRHQWRMPDSSRTPPTRWCAKKCRRCWTRKTRISAGCCPRPRPR
jgi:hypothetical protein